MKIPLIKDLDLKNKKVLVRVDFNVPMNPNGTISDLTRLRESLPTIRYILDQGGSVILMSHLGRPKGKKEPQFSLSPCAKALSELLALPVLFCTDCIGPEAEKFSSNLKNGEVLLLENLRFYPAEENPEADPSFARGLAKLGDIYINDAFGTAHRSHSSTATIARYFPKAKAAGFLLQKEISAFENILKNPKRPFYALIGGAKISSKLGVLKALLSKVDALFIGGGMAFTFFKAQNISIGSSIHEDDLLVEAKEFLAAARDAKHPVYFPEDLVIADRFDAQANMRTIPISQGIPDGWQAMDIGPETCKHWLTLLQDGKTIFWNGPFGVFEFPPFAKGTFEIAKGLTKTQAVTVVGGGDSVAAVHALGLDGAFTHLSTGGGASLEMIEYGHLPGIDALEIN